MHGAPAKFRPPAAHGGRQSALWFVACFLACCVGLPAPAADRPNFLWIMSEDNSKHYLELFDPAGAPTPNLAAMAAEGIVFERAFSNSPVCSVARTTLITSCYGPRIGTQFHRKLQPAMLPEGVQMFPSYLREAGYYTTNNNKEDYNAVKSAEVWDESSRQAAWQKRPDRATPFFHVQTLTLSHESRLHFHAKQMENEVNETASAEITLPPYHPDTPTFRYTHARYHDRIQRIDEAVGGVLETLREAGELENTFVFYFGDHGGVLPRSKGYAYESGLHVPLVVRVPTRFRDRVTLPRGSRTAGFVEFVDFGPTVLRLAGIDVPQGVDGEPFLGPQIAPQQLAARQEALGYADRFDEKYDLVRTLRVGRWKYMRNYEAFLFDGLQNNYRYRMLAYQQWRQLFEAGELDPVQQQFFQPKAVEALYDLAADPHEVRNLADDPVHADRLRQLRQRLQTRLKRMPDLSFFTETHLVAEALEAPVAFGQTHRPRAARLIETVDLSLEPFAVAAPRLTNAFQADDPLQRHWALVAASCFGEAAASLGPPAERLLDDPHALVQARAAQFLALATGRDPRPALYAAIAAAASHAEALEILNIAVFFHDHPQQAWPIEAEKLKLGVPGEPRGEVQRRIDYLMGNA